ncbi:cupin [Ectothiorhodospiraceae bacterium 2226]|nr:cupin [Ectothiorhodospiraceae bacterium 2226]
MSELRIYREAGADGAPAGEPRVVQAREDIARELAAIGVLFEAWEAERVLPDDATQDEVIEAYRGPIERLMRDNGFKSVDVVSMYPDHPDREALRKKFLDEHTHSDYEVRFFVDGSGLFYLHPQNEAGRGKVYTVLCERGDLISVPAGTPHWFDMGERPFFKAIRLFCSPEGWVADFTGSDIARRYPAYDELV